MSGAISTHASPPPPTHSSQLYYNIVSGLTKTECPGGEGLDKIIDLSHVGGDGDESGGGALAVRGSVRRKRRDGIRRLKVPERCSDFVVDHARVLALRGTYFGMRRGVDESVHEQAKRRASAAETRVALEAAALNEERAMRLTATAGKPTLNSVVRRTPWNNATMKHVYTGEVAQVLRQVRACCVYACWALLLLWLMCFASPLTVDLTVP